MKLHGIFPPLTTPFSNDGSLALDALRENVARYDRVRLGGYVVVGSTGESVLLSFEETERVWATVLEAAAPGKTLIAGTGAESTKETIDRTNRAAALGYQVALVRTPHYYKPQMTPAAELEHFLRVADAAHIPILIYSVPQFTGLAVEADTVARMAEHPNVIGIKESSGNVARVAEIIHATPRSFQTLVGSASTLFPSLALGAVGAVLALACVLPELCVELYEASRAGHTEKGATLQDRLLVPTQKLVAELGIPGIKYAMDCLGYHGGPARRPLLPLTDAQKRDVEAVLTAVAAVSASGN